MWQILKNTVKYFIIFITFILLAFKILSFGGVASKVNAYHQLSVRDKY